MNTNDIITTLVSIVSGAGGLQVFNMWKDRRAEKRLDKTENRTDFDTIIATYKEDNERLRKSEKELSERVGRLENLYQQCLYKLQLMESAHYDLPIPAWLKDTSGTMLSVNKAYEEIFLIPLGKSATDYIGKTDSEFWGEDLGSEYSKNDQKVFRSGKSQIVTETVMLPNMETTKWMILKYIRMAGNTKVGIAGIGFKEVDDV